MTKTGVLHAFVHILFATKVRITKNDLLVLSKFIFESLLRPGIRPGGLYSDGTLGLVTMGGKVQNGGLQAHWQLGYCL